MSTTPMNTKQLRAVLCDIIDAVRSQTMTSDAAEAVSNASGKIIASLRVELEYRRMRGEVPKLAFLEATDSDA